MKKLIIIMLTLLVLSGLAAVELKYWASVGYYSPIPGEFTDGSQFTRTATIFTPPVLCKLESVSFPFYLPGALGQATVKVEIWPVDANGLPNQVGFPLAGKTFAYAELVNWATANPPDDFNVFTIPTATNLQFGPGGANGAAFAMVLSSPNGVLGSIRTATLTDNVARGNSHLYYTTAPVGWDIAAENDNCFTANVTYLGDQVDVEATTIYFTGDFFLAPGEAIPYEVDVTNLSQSAAGLPIAVTGVDVYLALRDENFALVPDWPVPGAGGAALIAENVSMTPEEVQHYALAAIALPSTGGRYTLQLQAWHDDDVTMGNNNMFLQQDILVPPSEMAYDETAGSTAHAFYDAGDGWANEFWFYDAPLKITGVKFEMRDNTWPANATGNLSYAIYPADAAGMPDTANPLLDITPATCTLGAWNPYDVSALDIIIPAGEHFFIAYHQVGDYGTGAPGLMGDKTEPISSWLTSYAYYYDADLEEYVWETPNAYDEDMCIRCTVDLGVMGIEAPIISIMWDGYPTLEWAEVTGAVSYNVYGSNDPEAANPWTPIESGIQDLGYVYEGTEPYKFFYVTASTELDGSKMSLSPQTKASKPTLQPVRNNVISDKTLNKTESRVIKAENKNIEAKLIK